MAEAKLNKALNLVLQVDSDRGPIHVFAQPLARSIFEANFRLMAKAFASLYMENLVAVSGPKVAALLLLEQAEDTGKRHEAEELLNEMRRLTNVLVPRVSNNGSGGGYETIMYFEARKKGLISDDEAADIEGAVCFFTLVLRVGSPGQREGLLNGLRILWNAQTTSSNIMAFQASLATSTQAATTGPSATPPPETRVSSIPS
jgi:hypothetical protein